MTTTIDKDAKFLGVSLVVGRNMLNAWSKSSTRDISEIASKTDVQQTIPNAIALMSEFEANGLIGKDSDFDYRDEGGLTTKGRGLANANAISRTLKSKAVPILEELLDRIKATTSIKDFPRRITKVWIFGSMIDDAKHDVGDIDIVIESECAADFSKISVQDFDKSTLKRFASVIPRSAVTGHRALDEIVMDKYVFGKKRHRLFSPLDAAMLRSLHCPCKLVYDAERGGAVSDPVIPHHPDSKERGTHIFPRAVMPELVSSGEMSSAKFLSSGWFPVRDPSFWRQFSVDESASGKVVISPNGVAEMKAALGLPQMSIDFSKVNGRDEFLVWFPEGSRASAGSPRGWVSIKRSATNDHEDPSAKQCKLEIDCSISIHEVGSHDQFNTTHMKWIKAAVTTMLEADIKLVHERSIGEDMILSAKVTVDVRSAAGEFLHNSMSEKTADQIFSNIQREPHQYEVSYEAAECKSRRLGGMMR
jgi:predicted nucleotidyltransferase